jgi:copper homeostasis protein
MRAARNILLEICSYSVEDAIAAQASGADRIELCADRAADGITPAHREITNARKSLSINLHVMIRARGGDFLYSDSEFASMKDDVEFCRKAGVDGVVLGILLPDSSVDVQRTRELTKLASPMSVTFHRAFDVAADPLKSLEQIIELGCDRVLTSGQAPSALQGAGLIGKLIQQAGDRITIMPGARIRADNLAELIEFTGAREFHSAAYINGRFDLNEVVRMRKVLDRHSK